MVNTQDTGAPGLVIAGSASGTGKTTLATGLMAALSRRHVVAPFKVGPDYIDPGYHGVATGRPGRNLDSVMCGTDRIAPLYRHGSLGADIAVVEGVMGLFDGRIPALSSHGRDKSSAVDSGSLASGSTAEVARLVGLPVVFVIDVRGMSQSVGAVVKGFMTLDPDVTIAGVILNRVGSTRHTAVATKAVEEQGVPVIGAVPRAVDVEVPSRHLGLITTSEWSAEAQEAVDHMADMVEDSVDLDAVRALATPPAPGPVWNPAEEIKQYPSPTTHHHPGAGSCRQRPLIAMVGGPAFSFSYAEHRELLDAAGADVIDVDPLGDEETACDAVRRSDGIIIPGGFPEEHVKELSSRRHLAQLIRESANCHRPIHAECAGLLWLLESLEGYPMCGVFPASAHMNKRVTLGYREATATQSSVLWHHGDRLIGHEFHHTSLVIDDVATGGSTDPSEHQSAWTWTGWDGHNVYEGWVRNNIHASYLHTHPAAMPSAIVHFVDACREFHDEQASHCA
ncbi:cobyrinate a,c-diamide synthase [Corynebacterium sp. 23_3061]